MKTKSVKCSVCGFIFETPPTMVEREGCYTPSYCSQKDSNKISSFPLDLSDKLSDNIDSEKGAS